MTAGVLVYILVAFGILLGALGTMITLDAHEYRARARDFQLQARAAPESGTYPKMAEDARHLQILNYRAGLALGIIGALIILAGILMALGVQVATAAA